MQFDTKFINLLQYRRVKHVYRNLTHYEATQVMQVYFLHERGQNASISKTSVFLEEAIISYK